MPPPTTSQLNSRVLCKPCIGLAGRAEEDSTGSAESATFSATFSGWQRASRAHETAIHALPMVTPINTYAHAASTTTRTQEMLDNILMLDKIKALQISQLPKDEVEKLPEQHAAKTYRKQMSVLWAMKIVRKRCSWAMAARAHKPAARAASV